MSGVAPDPPEYEYKDDSARGRWGVGHDPLTIIELNYMQDSLGNPIDVTIPQSTMRALVEVARAARDIASRVVDGPGFELGEIFNAAGRLDAALARLDGEGEERPLTIGDVQKVWPHYLPVGPLTTEQQAFIRAALARLDKDTA